MYLHRFTKMSVHIVQTYLIIGWAKTHVTYTVFQHSQSEVHRGSTSTFCPALFLIVDFSRSILTSCSQIDIYLHLLWLPQQVQIQVRSQELLSYTCVFLEM